MQTGELAMSLIDTVSQAAATSPVVGVAVASQNTKSAILAGLQGGDPQTAALIGAVSNQALTANQLLASLTKVGQNVDIKA